MKAQFVYENLQLLNEDQKSFDDLSRLSKKIFNYFYEKYGPSKSLLDELDLDWNKIFDHVVSLSKFSSDKYPHIQKFMDSGLGLIYSNYNISSESDGGAGFFMNPTQYIPPENELDKKYADAYPSGLVLFGSTEVGSGWSMVLVGENNLIHEFQHAYDYWRSKGKSTEKRKYNAEKILAANPYSNKDEEAEKERKIYYNDTSELSGHFTEAIKGHYWAGRWSPMDGKGFIIDRDDVREGFYDWKDQLKSFKASFLPWAYLSEKMKKKYSNKFYTYYHKFKKIYDEEGYEGLDRLGLNHHFRKRKN